VKGVTAMDTMAAVAEIARKYDRDRAHSEKVADFSLAIFDDLLELHRYGRDERILLKVAGILHDIGYSQPDQKPHNKASRDLILGLEIPGMSEIEKYTSAQIARYHRGELPDASEHSHFASLSKEHREIVEWLAGMLRVADALDCGHEDIVRRLAVEVGKNDLIFSLDTRGDCGEQIKRAREKEELLVIKSGKEIKYRF
jgi:exopolyphosphatase/guanosine-5'-triphosphate,3'-diphosphate pyrophosphatase